MLNDIIKFLKPIFEELELGDYLKVSSSDKADFQINSVFQIAKDKHVAPKEIGEMLASKINENDNVSDYFSKVEFVMPGFINLFVSDKLINKHINGYITNGFVEKTTSNDVYFLDYGGPNVAKPLHIGHLRPAIIGESIKTIDNKTSHAYLTNYPNICWTQIMGLRDIIVHEYHRIDEEEIFNIIKVDLSPLLLTIRQMKKELPNY